MDSDDGVLNAHIEKEQAGIVYDSRTLRLIELLAVKSQVLADMLMGAWVTLYSTDNPDMLPQVAHSMRELIEKAPYKIPEVPVHKDDPNNRKPQIISLIRTYNGAEQTPAQLLTAQLDIMWNARELFMTIAHHGKPDATIEEVRLAIVSFEECLLNMINPEPIPDLAELDELIAEGEAL